MSWFLSMVKAIRKRMMASPSKSSSQASTGSSIKVNKKRDLPLPNVDEFAVKSNKID